MRRQEEVEAEDLAQLLVETRVGGAAGVAVVGDQHGRLLPVAHGVDAAVGEHVEEDVFVLEQEGVVARLVHRLMPVLDRPQVQLLHDAHLVHLQGDPLTAEHPYLRHPKASVSGGSWSAGGRPS